MYGLWPVEKDSSSFGSVCPSIAHPSALRVLLNKRTNHKNLTLGNHANKPEIPIPPGFPVAHPGALHVLLADEPGHVLHSDPPMARPGALCGLVLNRRNRES